MGLSVKPDFSSILAPFWSPFGSLLGPNWPPRGSLGPPWDLPGISPGLLWAPWERSVVCCLFRTLPRAPPGVPEAVQTRLGTPMGASREPPGVLLERSWRLLRRSRGALDGSWRLLAAPRALPGRFWRSPGALLGPFGALGPHSRAFFPFRKLFVLGFCATAAETATASWSLALETLDQLGL